MGRKSEWKRTMLFYIFISLFLRIFQNHNPVTTLLSFTWLQSKAASGCRTLNMLKEATFLPVKGHLWKPTVIQI